MRVQSNVSPLPPCAPRAWLSSTKPEAPGYSATWRPALVTDAIGTALMYGREKLDAKPSASLPWNCSRSGCTPDTTSSIQPGSSSMKSPTAHTNGGNASRIAARLADADEALARAREDEADRIDAELGGAARIVDARDAAELDARSHNVTSAGRFQEAG